MRKNLLKRCLLTLMAGWLAIPFVSAQGTYGNTLLFNQKYTSSWGVTGSFSLVSGTDTIGVVAGVTNYSATRAKPFTTRNNTTTITAINDTGAVKCTSVTLKKLSSLGQFNLALQNGNSKTSYVFTTQISTDNGATWTTADSITLAGNASTIITPENVVSKDSVQVRFVFPTASWFYGLSAYNHVNESSTAAPTILSVTPVPGSNLPANGAISVVLDELVKAGTDVISLGNATISSVNYFGNKALISYTGFTDATNPLLIKASSITNYNGTPLAADTSIAYLIDVTPPVLQSVTPTPGSIIHINDLGQTARKIAITFDEEIQIGSGALSFNGATLTPSVSGKVLTISYSGLPYNATDTLKIPSTYIKDLSGNALAADTFFVYHTGARDSVAPTLRTKSFTDGATLPIGGSVYFVFNELMSKGDSSITINGNAMNVSIKDSVVGVDFTNLNYGTSYTIKLPTGCLTDSCGNVYAGASFTFTTADKTAKAFDYIVAKDGTGDYTTIQAAINAAPSNSSTRTFIYVKKGVYNEKITVGGAKRGISLIGENRDSTIITWNECSSTATDSIGTASPGTDNSYTMLVIGPDFYAENLTVRNDYDYMNRSDANKQSVAFEHQGDKHVLKNCKFYSYQDTYYPKKADQRQYLWNCTIQGGTDFVFGSGTCFMDSCSIKCIKGGQYMSAASDITKEFGLVYNNCIITKADTAIYSSASDTTKQFYLGRPWKANCATAYINAKMDSALIRPEGWALWSTSDNNYASANYVEYNSQTLGGSPISTSSRVSWSKQLTAAQAARYTYGNAFNFGTSGTWNPLPYLTAPAVPTNAIVTSTGDLSWTAPAYGVGYLVFRNDSLIGKTTTTSYTDASYSPSAVYTIKASNEYGALSLKSADAVLSGINNAKVKTGFLVSNIVSTEITLIAPSQFNSVEVISIGGKKVITSTIKGSSVSIESLPVGIYLAKGYAKNGDVYVDKIVKK